jgi:hypothetical protein
MPKIGAGLAGGDWELIRKYYRRKLSGESIYDSKLCNIMGIVKSILKNHYGLKLAEVG